MERAASDLPDDLSNNFQFGWLDGNNIATSVILGHMPIPGLLVFNVSSYQFYLSEDNPEFVTKESLYIWLRSIRDGKVPPLGGRSLLQRIKRMAYELFTGIYSMFATQPLLTCCLFGLPLGFLAIICYSICSADFTVERDEIYGDEDDDVDDEAETDEDHEKVE